MRAIPWACAVLGVFVVLAEIAYSLWYRSLASTWVLMLVGVCIFLQGFYQIALYRDLMAEDEPESDEGAFRGKLKSDA